jgi:glyoxylase-like metal-dependent hydrolase (beta-lactamase superfamily II)
MQISAQPPYRIELPFALEQATVNAYLFLEPEPVLFDTGDYSDETWAALQDGLAQQGITVADLKRVVITHAHIDHMGNAARIAEQSDATFHALDVCYDWLVNFNAMWARRQRYYREIFFPYAGLSQATIDQLMVFYQWIGDNYRGIPADRLSTFKAGEQVSIGGLDWETIHTPGHASTLTCFYQSDSQRLIASDMLLQRTPTPVTETPPDGQDRVAALPLFIDSLDRIKALPVGLVYPGHGEPFEDVVGLVRRQQDRIASRKEQCYQYVAAGVETAADLMVKLYPASAGGINLAGLWMLIGYLDLLIAEQRVTVEDIDDVWRYRAT